MAILYLGGAEGARLLIVVVQVGNMAAVAEVLPVEFAETVAILVFVVTAERSWQNCGANNAVELDKLGSGGSSTRAHRRRISEYANHSE
jgi:hypothetical protein